MAFMASIFLNIATTQQARAATILLGDADIFPPIFVSTFVDRIGTSPFFAFNNTTQLRINALVFPSIDSDVSGQPFQGDTFFTTNGIDTVVSLSHPLVALPSFADAQAPGETVLFLSNPDVLAFCGLATDCGGTRNEFIYSVDLAVLSEAEITALKSEPFSFTISNPNAPLVDEVSFTTADTGGPGNLVDAGSFDPDILPDLVEAPAVTGNGTTPEVSWTVPCLTDGSDCTHNSVLFQIRRLQLSDDGQILAGVLLHEELLQNDGGNFDPAITSVDFSALGDFNLATNEADKALREGTVYEIAIRLAVSEPSILDPNSFHPVALSTTAFLLSPLGGDAPDDVAVFLPSVNSEGVFQFDVPVPDGETILIDPFVSIGFDYEVGATDPLFASVLLPEIDGQMIDFSLILFDVIGDEIVTGITIASLDTFNFLADVALAPFGDFSLGIGKFGIRGIPVGAQLDPTNPTAFVTELGFVSGGNFTGTMTPVTVFVAVPEPSTSFLFGAGLLGLGWLARRRRHQVPQKNQAILLGS